MRLLRAPITASFRVRFSLGIATILLPLVVFAGGTFYALNNITQSYQQIAEEMIEEIPPVSQLQNLVLLAQMPPNDYLLNQNPEEQKTFDFFAQQIEQNLTRLQATTFDIQEEHDLVAQAMGNWKDGKQLAKKLFAIHQPSADDQANQLMKDFDTHLNQCASALDQLEKFAFNEIREEQQDTANNVTRILIALGATLAIGLLLAILAGLMLARTVLIPLKLLGQGAANIGQGIFEKLNYSAHNEFGPVIETFNSMSVSLQQNQAALKELATRDSLTGLLNRREFQRLLTQELDRAQRASSSVSVILLDIDHFKRINDSYGHQVGDDVLRNLSALLSKQVRGMDHLARYGGEEFVIVTPNEASTALSMAERIRQAVEDTLQVDFQQNPFKVTASLGIACFPETATHLDELIRKADEALYQAKQTGRNRVHLCDETPASCHPPKAS